MKREELTIADFHYDLPDERIAKHPLDDRNSSKLLVRKNGNIQEDIFSNLGQYVPFNSLLVFNDTKVIAARLQFIKDTKAEIEIFCVEPYDTTAEQALNSTDSCIWQCMVGNMRRFHEDTVLELPIAGTTLRATIHLRRENDSLIKFSWE
jgi:S-adenosylmethionine:tRNA ribosyltransferase-isomerase